MGKTAMRMSVSGSANKVSTCERNLYSLKFDKPSRGWIGIISDRIKDQLSRSGLDVEDSGSVNKNGLHIIYGVISSASRQS